VHLDLDTFIKLYTPQEYTKKINIQSQFNPLKRVESKRDFRKSLNYQP